MSLQLRRVVTGHDANGRAVVKIDEISKNLVSGRPRQSACVVWTTEGFPVNNTGDADEGVRPSQLVVEQRIGRQTEGVVDRRQDVLG